MATQRDAPLDFGTITLESLDVAAIALDLLGSEELACNGRSARTLAKGKGMTAVLTAVRAGGEIHEHAAPGPVVIVPVTGVVTVEGLESRQSLSWARAGRYSSDKAKSIEFRPLRMPPSSSLLDSSPEETVDPAHQQVLTLFTVGDLYATLEPRSRPRDAGDRAG